MRSIPESDLKRIGGGLFSPLDYIELKTLIELPHMLYGAIEMYNYVMDRRVNGCQVVRDGDFFTRDFCRLIGKKPA